MARLARAEIFDPSEIVAVHLIGKTVRSCYLMGVEERSGRNFDHRKRWLEEKLKLLAANFGIDLLAFSCIPKLRCVGGSCVRRGCGCFVSKSQCELTERTARVWADFGKAATKPFEFLMKSRYWHVRLTLI